MKAIGWTFLVSAFATLSSHAEFDWRRAQRQYEENVRIAARHPFREFEKAAKSGGVATVKRLVDRGAPVSLQIPWPGKSFEGIPPCEQAIHHAAGNEQLEVVRLLLDRGADPNARDNQGWQPIHFAAAFGQPAMLEAVLQAGGNPAAKTRDGKSPLQLAEEFRQEDSVKFLKSLK